MAFQTLKTYIHGDSDSSSPIAAIVSSLPFGKCCLQDDLIVDNLLNAKILSVMFPPSISRQSVSLRTPVPK